MNDICKKKIRDQKFKDNVATRIKKISGQVNGIDKMIKDDRYCEDILIQLAAVNNALREISYLILKDHMCSCVANDIKAGDLSSLENALEIAKKIK